MAVYFFYRCPYEGPAGSRLQRFDDDTVLDWFRARWHTLGGTDESAVHERVTREMGCEVYSFFALFVEAAREGWPAPTSAAELGECVESAVYNNRVLCRSPHLLQVDTDDDEVGLAYYFFDDHYLARHRDRAAFLLRDGWRLPAGRGPGGFRPTERTIRLKPRGHGEGTTYLIDLDHVPDMEDLVDGYRIDGVRLPELARYLACLKSDPEGGSVRLLPRALLTVVPAQADPLERAFVQEIRERPGEEAAWNAYSDWLQERGELPAGLHLLRRALTWAGQYFDLPAASRPELQDDLTEDLASAARWGDRAVRAIEHGDVPGHSRVHVEEHVAQLCLRYDHWKTFRRELDLYHEWIYFDDLWASAHPDLANAILRYVRRWDVLSLSRTAGGER